ncbi:MAG TPA: metallophosphoesterase [Vicinamibacterales bacterium]|jgi:Icc-related predicted phosphoesterase|nr:metallophosphoesterase [Vicinamibacterales bacterium]
MASKDLVRIAAIGDLHYGRASQAGSLQPLFSQINESADVLALCGDITDYGLVEEARAFVKELVPTVKIPVVAVLGNHDVESNQQDEIKKILKDAGVAVLDGETIEIHGVGFAGIKGFAGGFGRRALGPWGEDIIKRFVREAVDEALKLESALARLRNDRLVVLVHYAPIQGTVEGEPCDIYPFLGCSRLEEPITRFPVSAVFHGHAHHGAPEGRTRTNVPVYNVSASLMREHFPDRPFRLVELAQGQPAPQERRSGERRVAAEVH